MNRIRRVVKLISNTIERSGVKDIFVPLKKSPYFIVVLLLGLLIIPAIIWAGSTNNTNSQSKQPESVSGSSKSSDVVSTPTVTEDVSGNQVTNSVTQSGGPSDPSTSINVQTSSNGQVTNTQTGSSTITVDGQAVPVPKNGVVNKTVSSGGNRTNVQISNTSNSGSTTSKYSTNTNINISDNSSSNSE